MKPLRTVTTELNSSFSESSSASVIAFFLEQLYGHGFASERRWLRGSPSATNHGWESLELPLPLSRRRLGG
jgi:hypothetical protein